MSSSSKINTSTMVAGAVAGVALLAAIMWPRKASAAPAKATPAPPAAPPAPPKPPAAPPAPPKPPAPPSSLPKKTCPDGSVVPEGAVCPAAPAPAPPPECLTSLNTAPVPLITTITSGLGAAPSLDVGLFHLGGTPTSVKGDPCSTLPTDALAFLQGWDAVSGYQPIYDDGGTPSPVAAVVHSAGSATGVMRALDPKVVFDSPKSSVSNYFDPKLNARLPQLLSPGTMILIWTTDLQGNPLSWWLTTWSPSTTFTS